MHTDESRRHSAGFLTAFQFRPCGYRHSEGRTQHTASRLGTDIPLRGTLFLSGICFILELYRSHEGGRFPCAIKYPPSLVVESSPFIGAFLVIPQVIFRMLPAVMRFHLCLDQPAFLPQFLDPCRQPVTLKADHRITGGDRLAFHPLKYFCVLAHRFLPRVNSFAHAWKVLHSCSQKDRLSHLSQGQPSVILYIFSASPLRSPFWPLLIAS